MTKCIRCRKELHNKDRCCNLDYQHFDGYVIIRDKVSRPETATMIKERP